MHIHEVSEQVAIDYWRETLWKDFEVRSSSSIIYNTLPFEYDLSYHQQPKTFLGLFDETESLVGINSFHQTNDAVRSRGLFVEKRFRGKGLGVLLLKETIHRAGGVVWSIPKRTALSTYLKSGFKQTSDFFETDTSKENCYVSL